jgi:hypothetical protein
MSPYDEVYARIERIKELWRELQRTPRKSPSHRELMGKIRTESAAYLSLIDGQAGRIPAPQ